MTMQKTYFVGHRVGSLASAAALASTLALAACGAPADQTSKMTSYSATETAANKAALFTVPAEQMSRIQIVTVAQQPLERMLRLSGSIAYNGFQTTPVITQVSGPVSRIVVVPGQHVKAGEPMLYVASPDFSQLRSGYIKSRDAYQFADRAYKRAEDLYTHKAISQADLEQADSARVQAQADLQSSEQAIRILGIPDPEKTRHRPPIARGSVARAPVRRDCRAVGLARPVVASWWHSVLHAFGHEYRVGAG